MRTHIFKSSPRRTAPAPTQRPPSGFSETIMDENISAARSVIERWKPSPDHDSLPCSSASLFSPHTARREAKDYIQAVDSLQGTMRYAVSVNPASKKLAEAQAVMQTAMEVLGREFYGILKKNREHLDPESLTVRSNSGGSGQGSSTRNSFSGSEDGDVEDDDLYDCGSARGPDADAMDNLKTIADCMISAGYAKECLEIYKTIRRSMVDEALYNLGVERLATAEVQKMECKILAVRIKKWLRAVRYVVRILFHGERILCDHVFSASTSVGESCFTEIAKEGALTLFGFPESVRKCRRILAPDKIFCALDMYEAISGLLPEIEAIFSFGSTAAVRSQAVVALSKLSEAVRLMMDEFELAIKEDISKSPLPGGGVHPLTRYVMNYISLLSEYSRWLEYIFAGWKLTSPSPLPESSFGDESRDDGAWSSPVTVRLAWVILLVLCKVDGKAQLYDDPAQAYLFLANNQRYVVVKVRTSNLKLLLGDHWCERHEAKVRSYTASYEKLAWGNVMASLPERADLRPHEARDCFRRFNVAFEKACKRQSSWVVPDQKLRDEIKVSVARKLGEAYREFYERYRVELTTRASPEEYSVVRFAPEDLDNYLSDLFFVTSGSGSVSLEKRDSPGSSPVRAFGKKLLLKNWR